MAVRIKWDKYEAALLIDTFWLIENEPTRRKEYIQNLLVPADYKRLRDDGFKPPKVGFKNAL